MTPEELDQIEARANAATEGPWAVNNQDAAICSESQEGIWGGMEAVVWPDGQFAFEDNDGAFIAAARTDVPALVAEVRRLRAVIDRLTGDDAAEEAQE